MTVWSDIHCPWAMVTVHRLRAARDADGLDVVFDQRAWPLELVNGQGTPKHIVPAETAVLSNHEPTIFGQYTSNDWPSTFLPAFELVAAARRVHGPRAAEDLDYQLRLAFFRDSVNTSIRAGLERVLSDAAAEYPCLDPAAILAEWDAGSVRADVLADYRRSKDLPIQGSPQVFWPDGSTTHNPGMTDHEWVRGLPRIRSADPDEPGRLLRAALAVSSPGGS
ncbi:MAG: DsbA family protein [Pseudonocardia sp.]|nr:DsbA family protein [Pseudonocardia sp.]MBO0875704.1 DsbA family protein [Pseudonocardia sp.]